MNILTIAGFFANLFSIGGFIKEVLNHLVLAIDAIGYFLLSYAYKVFHLMCTLNFNSLYGIISGVLTRIEALVMVFVVYKLGITLINFMLSPDEAAKKGKDILISIFVCAALLLGYNTVFTLFNELSMLIVGTPEDYNYVVLGEIAELTGGKDTGLINRIVFGTDEEIPDIGDYIAFSICSSFITYTKDPQNTSPLKKILTVDDDIDFFKLPDIDARIGKDFKIFYIVGFLAAAFMVYSLVKATIQIGVRAFKLLILQILAPVAIISIIGEGIKGKTFKNFLNKYISVYIEVFIRMFSMLLVCNFVVKFVANIKDYFPTISTDDWFAYAVMIVLLIIAAFKFAGDIPKFIDEILSTHLGDGKSNSFGRFVGGLLGGAVGGVVGGAVGFFGGLAGGGWGAGIAGLRSGVVGGISSGAKGKNVADFFKGQSGVAKNTFANGQNIRAKGGLIQSDLGAIQGVLGVGSRQDKSLGDIDRQKAALDAYDSGSAQELKEMGATVGSFKGNAAFNAARADAESKFESDAFANVKMSSKDEFKAGMREYNKEYIAAQAELAVKEKSGSQADIAEARLEVQKAMKRADDASGELYEAARASLSEDKDTHTYHAASAYRKAARKSSSAPIDIKAEQASISSERYRITDKASYARTHGQNPRDKK